jgi:hypothetical protein
MDPSIIIDINMVSRLWISYFGEKKVKAVNLKFLISISAIAFISGSTFSFIFGIGIEDS